MLHRGGLVTCLYWNKVKINIKPFLVSVKTGQAVHKKAINTESKTGKKNQINRKRRQTYRHTIYDICVIKTDSQKRGGGTRNRKSIARYPVYHTVGYLGSWIYGL